MLVDKTLADRPSTAKFFTIQYILLVVEIKFVTGVLHTSNVIVKTLLVMMSLQNDC